ncbi:kelch motif domain-containing protein, putative [Eimeria brunetti]|uniref:Kelch motif domain-containing protein, putative n=1 Tax=Eimeria brunetti TaxID=51314 RepID=U6LX26_9EIME|nr:kelch motif domain-containing protein, putative [Eimeria brunetti]
MSDISDFSESELDKPQTPKTPPPKPKAKAGAPPAKAGGGAPAAAAVAAASAAAADSSAAAKKAAAGRSPAAAEEAKKGGSSSEAAAEEKGGAGDKKDSKSSSSSSSSSGGSPQQQQQAAAAAKKAAPRSQRSLERAKGVLSPPDFFISKVVHDWAWRELESASGELAPCGRCGHSASLCEIEGRTFVAIFGGDISGSGKGENDLWLFDVQENNWDILDQVAGQPPCPRWKHAAAFFDNRLWIIGGTYAGWFKNYVMSGYPCADVYRLAPVCTTVSLSALSQDMSKTVKEIRSMRGEIEAAAAEAAAVRSSMVLLQQQQQQQQQQLEGVGASSAAAAARLTEVAAAVQQMDAAVKKAQQEIEKGSSISNSISLLEKKFNIMEQTLQEALAKIEKKADISSLRAVAAKVGSISDEEEE